MQGISAVLNIAKSALRVQQVAMEVASNNIANVNTPGYTRQTALLENQASFLPSATKLGMGVQIASVVQAFDQSITRTIHQNTSVLAENEAKASVLSYLENIFNETSGQGLSQALNEFWSAWQELASNPEGIPERTALLGKGDILWKHFNSMSDQLHQVIRSMNTYLGGAIAELNQTTERIAFLNEKITAAESNGTLANDLRDQRNVLLEKLSGLVGTMYYENENGSLTVMTSDGTPLVEGNQSRKLIQDGNRIISGQGGADISQRLAGGKIGAWLDIRDEIAPQYLANLDELAGTLIQQVNAQHLGGYALSGETGLYFFEDFVTLPALPNSGNFTGAAGFIRLSSDIRGKPANIAAGGISGAPGDNENALRILNIQTDDTSQIRKWTYENRGANRVSNLQNANMDDYYRTLAGDMGILTAGVNQSRDFTQTMLFHLEEARSSISGVNLDEEMTELLKIQRAYEAAAKIIAIVDELLQSLLRV
ncbi:MAG: flagellar hook-associated protein FlgK [Deltaproteobacteria bacterium]|nr:flagellar hook-associated protein FlgK [Deltaproteobacteria bacterium]